MEFLDKLKVKTASYFDYENFFDKTLKPGIRICEWIRINEEYELSIQASGMHYCTPRGMIPVKEYEDYEVAIIKNEVLINAEMPLDGFKRANELYFGDTVLAYVPRDLVNDIYLFMKEKYKDDFR